VCNMVRRCPADRVMRRPLFYHGCSRRVLQVVTQLVDADQDGEAARQYRTVKHDSIFGTAFDPDGYYSSCITGCPKSALSACA
jgi:hypothetical protein